MRFAGILAGSSQLLAKILELVWEFLAKKIGKYGSFFYENT